MIRKNILIKLISFIIVIAVVCSNMIFSFAQLGINNDLLEPVRIAGSNVVKQLGLVNGEFSFIRSIYQPGIYFAANYFPILKGAMGDDGFDDSQAIQETLNLAAANGGGIVYLSKGLYHIKNPLNVPNNVTLKGDFISPTSKKPVKSGTVFVITDTDANKAKEFITLNDNSSLSDITFWYENQHFVDIITYPATIKHASGKNVVIRNIAVINAFDGIELSSPNCLKATLENIYISTLSSAVTVNYCQEKLIMENVYINPVYWVNSTLNTNSKDVNIQDVYEQMQATVNAVTLKNVKDLAVYNINIDTVSKGLVIRTPAELSGAQFLSNVNINSTTTPVFLQSASNKGISFINCSFKTTELFNTTAMIIDQNFISSAVFNTCSFLGQPQKSFYSEGWANISFVNCLFYNWREIAVDVRRGAFTAVNSDFVSSKMTADISEETVGTIVNSVNSEFLWSENENIVIENTLNEYTFHPMKKEYFTKENNIKFAKTELFNIKDYGAATTKYDNTIFVQNAIDAAFNAGGGVVCIPRGEYFIRGTLVLKSKVQLVGVGSKKSGSAYSLFKTVYNLNNDIPLITMESNAAISNLAIEYTNITTEEAEVVSTAIYSDKDNIYIEDIEFINAPGAVKLTESSNVNIHSISGTPIYFGLDLYDCQNVAVEHTIFDKRYETPETSTLRSGKFVGFKITDGKNLSLFDNTVENADYGILFESSEENNYNITPNILVNTFFATDVYAGICVINYGYAAVCNTYVSPKIFDKNAYHVSVLRSNNGLVNICNLIGSGETKGNIYSRGGTVIFQSSIFNETGENSIRVEGGTVSVLGSVFVKAPTNNHFQIDDGNAVAVGNIINASQTYPNADFVSFKRSVSKTGAFNGEFNFNRIMENSSNSVVSENP